MPGKGIVRAQPIWNFLSSASALSTAGNGDIFDVSTGSSGRMVYAGLHLTSTNLGGTPTAWTIKVQSATSCAFGSPTDRFTFTAQTCAGAQMPTPIAYPAASTECQYWRGVVTPTTTTDARLGLIWVAVE